MAVEDLGARVAVGLIARAQDRLLAKGVPVERVVPVALHEVVLQGNEAHGRGWPSACIHERRRALDSRVLRTPAVSAGTDEI